VNLLRKIALRLLFGNYEAGETWNPRRSYVRGAVRDARYDADAMTRHEIVRKVRAFERNSGLVQRLADLFEQYTVGPAGLRFVPDSSDQDWNRRNADEFTRWSELCDLTSRHHFGTVQSLAARSWFIDGEVFILKTSGRLRGDGQSFPRIQPIESHRVQTPPEFNADERVIDGVRVDERGRPAGYYVRESVGVAPFQLSRESFQFVPAERMVHVFEPSRIGMYRGLPFFYAVLNDLHDLDDLQLLEMDAAKDAAAKTQIIKTKTGELDQEALRAQRFLTGGKQGTSGGSSQERVKYYEEVFGADVKVMRHQDEYNQFVSGRPSVAVQAYWEHLISKICAGVGISKLLVLPFSMQGTVTRADLDVANTFFRSRSAVLAAALTEIYLYVTEWATRNVRELADPPADWRRVSVRPPRSVNVDVGRNSQALISEYAAGWRTLNEICGELGHDWRDVLRARAVERQAARELELEFGLREGELIAAALEAISRSSAATEPNPPEPAPEPQPQPA